MKFSNRINDELLIDTINYGKKRELFLSIVQSLIFNL